MAPRGLTFYARMFLNEPASLRRALDAPVLVWEAPPETAGEEVLFGTFSGISAPRPTRTEPIVYELKKGSGLANAFALGITIGRTGNNDVHMEDHSVSRFHAYIQKDPKGRWTLVDAESKNGTFLDGKKLSGRTPLFLQNGSKLTIGSVVVTFFQPDAFIEYLKARLDES
ncbi:MAG: FHA domain-containing protein [Myxococcaceae bacterium]